MIEQGIVRCTGYVLRQALVKGVLWFCNHVDVDQVGELHLLRGVIAAKQCFEKVMKIQA